MTQVATKQRRAAAPQKRAPRQAPAAKPARKRAIASARQAPEGEAAEDERLRRPSRQRASERGGGQGGRRLATAFDAASRLPALAESRRRLLRASEREGASPGELAEAIESDVALTIAVMRAAGEPPSANGRTGGVRQAIEALSAPGVREVVASIDTYDPFDSPSARRPTGTSASGVTRWPPVMPPTGSASWRALGSETSWRSRPSFTTSGAWCCRRCTGSSSSWTTGGWRPTRGCDASAGSLESTMPWSARSSSGAGASPAASPPRWSDTTRRGPAGMRRRSGSPT